MAGPKGLNFLLVSLVADFSNCTTQKNVFLSEVDGFFTFMTRPLAGESELYPQAQPQAIRTAHSRSTVYSNRERKLSRGESRFNCESVSRREGGYGLSQVPAAQRCDDKQVKRMRKIEK